MELTVGGSYGTIISIIFLIEKRVHLRPWMWDVQAMVLECAGLSTIYAT